MALCADRVSAQDQYKNTRHRKPTWVSGPTKNISGVFFFFFKRRKKCFLWHLHLFYALFDILIKVTQIRKNPQNRTVHVQRLCSAASFRTLNSAHSPGGPTVLNILGTRGGHYTKFGAVDLLPKGNIFL